ncbi:FAD-linked oxidoreductase [Cylindrobasidium torrendii FP15055 ss-10]|uniref:Proline dehydrogenase n=1 Tax=Cylindrobasidium torrendii FP15055 ss-10 TaxID=1314674 RepID=A0A0D7BT26_9AGAR|nr:FAD-linked oxidoreductase [Cylindrobasidium torrendii FP15055 ss-10]
MILRLLSKHPLPRGAFRSSLGRRPLSTQPPKHTPTFTGRRALTLLALGASPFLFSSTLQSESVIPLVTDNESQPSLRDLIRTYVVYTLCSSETIIDHAPGLLETLTSVPVLKQITEALVRVTFFDQFVGGDTAAATIPLLKKLRTRNLGCLFAYSVEVDEHEAMASAHNSQKTLVHKRSVDEMVHCIDVAADFEDIEVGSGSHGRRTWIAIKLTALLPNAEALLQLSQVILQNRHNDSVPFPGCPQSHDLDVLYAPGPNEHISPENIAALKDLHSDVFRICKRARERGVKVIVDAEYSWYQPALDAYQLSLMEEFNKVGSSVQPLVYGTYQAYLRRTYAHLEQSLKHARANGYTLGVKLVRGAYHPLETSSHQAHIAGKASLSISPEPLPPVWQEKSETHFNYDSCAKLLIREIKKDILAQEQAKTKGAPRIGVLFGTHNWTSCKLILQELVDQGLASIVPGTEETIAVPEAVTERLVMGQLYGMCDALTEYLVNRTQSAAPLVLKYVPYGALSEVMPYLSRRAIENKSVLGEGAAKEERRRAVSEIRRAIFG